MLPSGRQVEDMPVPRCRRGFSGFQRVLKAVGDRVGAALGLVFFAPFMLLVAILLKWEGQGGSIFYGGQRVGKDGRFFRCWKFRSMEPGTDHLLRALLASDAAARAEWETYRKLKNDPRVQARTARVIRRLSIDELPQLWNVLTGSMSLVGPRPILPDEQDLFGPALDIYCAVRPGITGLWQVSGRNDTSFEERVALDVAYVRQWSLWQDIVILFKTVYVVVARKGVY